MNATGIMVNEIKAARVRLGFTQKNVAEQMKMNVFSYQKKESGAVRFTDSQKIQLAKILQLSNSEMNDFLFNGELPI